MRAIAAIVLLSAAPLTVSTGTDPAKEGTKRLEADIPYAEGGDENKLDLYLPEQKEFTTIVFTYGGGWHRGSRKSVAAIGEMFQGLGYGCVLPSHRLGPKDKFPAQAEDMAAAFAWVYRNIAAKGGDPKRIVLMGHSSGAHLSLLIATDPKYLATHKLTPADISGVIGLSSPVDLEPRKEGKGFGDALMAGRGADVFSRDTTVMRDASPLRHISKKLPRTCLIVGERDFPMLEGDAKAFLEKATAEQAKATLLVAKGRDHMGTVQALLEEKSDVRESVQEFLAKLKK